MRPGTRSDCSYCKSRKKLATVLFPRIHQNTPPSISESSGPSKSSNSSNSTFLQSLLFEYSSSLAITSLSRDVHCWSTPPLLHFSLLPFSICSCICGVGDVTFLQEADAASMVFHPDSYFLGFPLKRMHASRRKKRTAIPRFPDQNPTIRRTPLHKSHTPQKDQAHTSKHKLLRNRHRKTTRNFFINSREKGITRVSSPRHPCPRHRLTVRSANSAVLTSSDSSS